jgi:hypothetical protein
MYIQAEEAEVAAIAGVCIRINVHIHIAYTYSSACWIL